MASLGPTQVSVVGGVDWAESVSTTTVDCGLGAGCRSGTTGPSVSRRCHPPPSNDNGGFGTLIDISGLLDAAHFLSQPAPSNSWHAGSSGDGNGIAGDGDNSRLAIIISASVAVPLLVCVVLAAIVAGYSS